MSNLAINVRDLSKLYRIGAKRQRHDTLRESIMSLLEVPKGWFGGNGQAGAEEDLWALRDVSFDVKHGEVVGIIGRNGAGKSTLLKILSRVTKPTRGRADIHGRMASLLEIGTGFHPELTGQENIYLNGAILGMKRTEIEGRFDDIVAFAEIERFLDTPVKRYSSGMYLRLAFAVAAHLEPEILTVDEVLAVGDWEFQQKCLGKMRQVAGEGRTVLFVSHNMDVISSLCKRAIMFENGLLREDGPAAHVIHHYLGFADHISSKALNLHSKEIDLEEIRLKNARGEQVFSFSWEESFVIEVSYEVRQPRKWISIGLVIFTSRGEPVLTTASRGAAGNKRLRRGKGISSVKVPGQFLSPGEYSIFVNAHSIHDLFCEAPNAISFRIEDKGREVLGREGQMKWPGLVCPQLHWTNSPFEAN